MNSFDKAFARADVDSFRGMSDTATLYNLGASAGTTVSVIEMPLDHAAQYRQGGEGQFVRVQFEVSKADFDAAQAEIGWKIRIGDRDFRIVTLTEQGGTITLTCGDITGDDTGADW